MPKKKADIDKIHSARQASSAPRILSAFIPLPTNMRFQGQDKDESIVLLLRAHPATMIPQLAGVIFMFFIPLFYPVLSAALDTSSQLLFIPTNAPTENNIAITLGAITIIYFMTISFAYTTIVQWYFNLILLTEKRILDIDFREVITHNVSEAALDKIEDVSHAPAGFSALIFDYGNVYVQTAGEKREFEIKNVPKAREVQDIILDTAEQV